MKKKIAAIGMAVLLACGVLTGCQTEKESQSTDVGTAKKSESGADLSEKTDQPEKEQPQDPQGLEKVTLNEVAHSIFYAPQYVAIENGYFKEEGIDLELVTGYGADKTMAAVISGDAQIGFMGAEASVYAYLEGANDPVVNFAQGTQRAGNFLVAREAMPDFQWSDLKGKEILGGRKGVGHLSM